MKSTKASTLTSIVMSVFKLNGHLIEWGNQFSDQHGLTSARWQMLGAIMLVPHPASIPQIAAAIGMTRQGVLKQINQLVGDGLVEPLPNPAHKRSPLYRLTADGRAIYDAIEARWQAHARQVAAEFTKEDLGTALKVVSILSQIHDDKS